MSTYLGLLSGNAQWQVLRVHHALDEALSRVVACDNERWFESTAVYLAVLSLPSPPNSCPPTSHHPIRQDPPALALDQDLAAVETHARVEAACNRTGAT